MNDRVADVTFAGLQLVGRYELLSMIGTGGMASVHLAKLAGAAGFRRLFAVKILHPHLIEDDLFVTMLLDEARLAARIHHPNVVPIIDLGMQGGLPYLVMEYVAGCPLWRLLKASRDERPAHLIIPIVLDTLSGLQAAHSLVDDDGNSMRVVHRDVTPHNILVGIDGVARLTDFGVARAELRSGSTRAGQLKGKVAYMSPEQLQGAPLDGRSDIFAVGSLLWSALTGVRLFVRASDAETMRAILTEPISPPSSVGLRPPATFDAIILKALARDAAQRFANAQEMEDALREVAMRERLLGSKREVGEWGRITVGKELAMRHARARTLSKALTTSTAIAEPAVHFLSKPSAIATGFRGTPLRAQPELEMPRVTGEPLPRRPLSSRPVRVHGVAHRSFWKLTLGLAVACAVFVLLWSFEDPRPARQPTRAASNVAPHRSPELAPSTASEPNAQAPTAVGGTTDLPPEVAPAAPAPDAAAEARPRPPRTSAPRTREPKPSAPVLPPSEERPALPPESARTQRWDMDSPQEPL